MSAARFDSGREAGSHSSTRTTPVAGRAKPGRRTTPLPAGGGTARGAAARVWPAPRCSVTVRGIRPAPVRRDPRVVMSGGRLAVVTVGEAVDGIGLRYDRDGPGAGTGGDSADREPLAATCLGCGRRSYRASRSRRCGLPPSSVRPAPAAHLDSALRTVQSGGARRPVRRRRGELEQRPGDGDAEQRAPYRGILPTVDGGLSPGGVGDGTRSDIRTTSGAVLRPVRFPAGERGSGRRRGRTPRDDRSTLPESAGRRLETARTAPPRGGPGADSRGCPQSQVPLPVQPEGTTGRIPFAPVRCLHQHRESGIS